jgi:hypothetical protein
MPLIGVNCSPPLPENPTIAALNQIVKNYKDYLQVGETESQAKIIELLDSPRKTYNLDFQQFEPKKWWLFWYSPERQDFSNWTDAIQNYQQQAVEQQKQAGVKGEFILHPTGEIKAKDSTDQYLRCELRKNLKLPSNQVERGKCQKYGVTGLTLATNPPPDLRPTPSPSVSPQTSPSATPKPSRTSSRPSPSPTPTLSTAVGSETPPNGSGDMDSANWPTTSIIKG